MNCEQKFIEIPFGANDSKLKGWEYTIPEGMEAIVKDGKVIVKEKESEDERITRAINNMLPFIPDKAYVNNGVTKEDVLAWLEKQKEQKPQDQCVDVIKMSALLAADRLASAEMTGRLKERKEILENPEKYGLCKPAEKQKPTEWSEEDEDFINILILHFNYLIDKGGDSVETYKSYREKLKSLRPQPKQEWSEEDGIDLNDAIKYVQNYGETSSDEYAQLRTKEIVDWLKSLRPPLKDREMKLKILKYLSTRCSSLEFEEVEEYLNNLRPSWKPSEEEMDALKETISQDCAVCNGDRKWIKPNLESLYEQLKAL